MKEGYRYAVTLVVVALALAAAYVLYHRYSVTPWTRDAQVRANIVGIAPRVHGPIVQIPVKDNQPVKKGDLLFEIDPSDYQAAVNNASANLQQTEANALQAQQNLTRQTELFKKNVVGEQDYQNAQDQFYAASANVAAAKANSRPPKSTIQNWCGTSAPKNHGKPPFSSDGGAKDHRLQ